MSGPQYGQTHRRLREQWAKAVKLGDVFCCECGRPIEADSTDWHLAHDHTDPEQRSYLGVAHHECNEREGNTRRTLRRVIRENRPTHIDEDGQPRYWSRQWLASARRFEGAA